MCGSNDIVKENDLYVCQNCGTKYSPDEAKKMYQKVEVQGKVQVDKSPDVENLEILLDRNINNKQWDEVAKYARDILEKDPNNWKAIFYKELGEAWVVPYNDITPIREIIPATKTAISILETEASGNEILENKNTMGKQINDICYGAAGTALKNYKNNYQSVCSLWKVLETNIELEEYAATIVSVNERNNIYSEIVRYASELEVKRSYRCPNGMDSADPDNSTKEYAKQIREKYTQKIQETNPNYTPEKAEGDGCYVATAVYGSYNCPEVWTLRRFRDETLYRHMLGRIFIRAYYSTSPYLVKYFGKTRTFNRIFRKPLDSFVKRLQKSGVESTYYVDNKYRRS